MMKTVKRSIARLLIAALLLGLFVMPAAPVEAAAEEAVISTDAFDRVEAYQVVKGKESAATNNSSGGFTLKAGTLLEWNSGDESNKSIIDYAVYTMLLKDTNGFSMSTASYFELEIILSYLDQDNYRFLRIFQGSSIQHAYYNTVTDGVCGENNIPLGELSGDDLLDPAKPIKVTIDKRGTSSVVTLSQENADSPKSWTLDIPTLDDDKQTLVLGGATMYQKATVIYSDFQVEPLTLSESVRYDKEYNAFVSKYAELMNLTELYYSKNYQEDILSALTEYENLSDYVKNRLSEQITKLRSLHAELDSAVMEEELAPTDPDYRTYTNDFEGTLAGLTNFSSTAVTSEIVEDNGGHALVMRNGVSPKAGLILKSYMVPANSVITAVEYDFRVNQRDDWQQIRFMLAYEDVNNYTYVSFEIQENNRFAVDFWEVVDGVALIRRNDVLESSVAEQTDFTSWGHVRLAYVGKSVNISLFSGDAGITNSFSCSSFALKPVLMASDMHDTYIDNVSVTYAEYEETTTDESEKLAVYYTGNTEQYPNDAVMVTGNNIFENVSSIQIKEIANTSDFTTQSYIMSDWYDEIGYEGAFIHASDADYSEEAWADAVTVDVIQPTEGTLKFVIPQEFTKGMYAVRFNDYDFTSTTGDAIYLLNRPRISFVSGDEGKIVTAGGSLKIVGDMLVWGYDQEVTSYPRVKVLIKNEEHTFLFDSDDITVESGNGFQLAIPADMPLGDYEISVYNGIGGTNGWAAPVELTVGESPRASWPKEVFNVKDFGATGNQWENATGAVVKALEAAALNGGGIVYFPEGQYNLCNSIVIPENVVVKGDGAGQSIIFWSMDMWPDGSLPSYAVGFTKNVEFKDLGFYACRVASWFVSEEADVKNVYFNDLYIYTNPFAQYATNANSGADGSGIDRDELFDMIRDEINDDSRVFSLVGGDMTEEGAQNIRFNNVTLKQSGVRGCLRGISTECDYFYANNFNMSGGGWDTIASGTSAIFQNSEHSSESLSVLGIGMYFYNNELHDNYNNNRELSVADFPEPDNIYGLKKLDRGSAETGDADCWYEIVGGERDFTGTDSLRFHQIKVVSGQGNMQSRYIVRSEDNVICLNSPFAVTPDNTSVVHVRRKDGGRQDSYFIQNTLNEGGTGMGWFSGGVGMVYDGNVRTRSGVYIYTWGNDAIWYMSFVNESFDEPYMFGGYGYQTGDQVTVSNDHGGYTSLHLASGPSQPPGAFLAFTVRRSQFLNGSYIDFIYNMGDDSARGILIEDNVFDRVSKPIIFYSTYGGLSNFDGALVRNNVFTRVNEAPTTSGASNGYGSPRVLVMNEKTTASGEKLVKGDVNGDGKVTLKDVSVLKYYLGDMVTLDAAAQNRADVNTSGYVTLKDASTIRHYVTYGVWILNYVDAPDNNDGFFGGDW